MGIFVFLLDLARMLTYFLSFVRIVRRGKVLRYLTVATSDAVVNETGPAILNGNFATVRWPFSSVKTKTRFEPPSIFSQLVMAFALPRDRILWHSAPKSKLM